MKNLIESSGDLSYLNPVTDEIAKKALLLCHLARTRPGTVLQYPHAVPVFDHTSLLQTGAKNVRKEATVIYCVAGILDHQDDPFFDKIRQANVSHGSAGARTKGCGLARTPVTRSGETSRFDWVRVEKGFTKISAPGFGWMPISNFGLRGRPGPVSPW